MLHTFIVLDGHPNTFITAGRPADGIVDPALKVPHFPIWTSMVSSSLEFCRIVWEIQSNHAYPINVLVANKRPIVLNHIDQQTTAAVEKQFPHAQPRELSSEDRMQQSVEKAFTLYAQSTKQDNISLRRCRIVLLTLVKDETEKLFQFRNNVGDTPRDLRAMVHSALKNVNNLNPTKRISHVDVDVLRLLPQATTPEAPLPCKVIGRQIQPEITMSIYTIPNMQDSLLYAMRHLAQLHYNINALHITNIPMKSAAAQQEQQSTQTVTFYYQSSGTHLINQPEPLAHQYIHEPDYLAQRSLTLAYSKRSKRALSETEWCSCLHTVTPLKKDDAATQVYVGMTLQGSISYLASAENNHTKVWTHMLMAHEQANRTIIYLHCLDNPHKQLFAQTESDVLARTIVKTEGNDYEGFFAPSQQYSKPDDSLKVTELIDTMIRPNLYDNIKHYLESAEKDALCKLVPVNPLRFCHHIPLIHSSTIMRTNSALQTSRFIEKATRWRTCFRDCGGTNLFPITLDNEEKIEDLAIDVLNGVPVNSGFAVISGLVSDLFEQLQDVLMSDQIQPDQVISAKRLINTIVSGLMDAMQGTTTKKLFIKGLRKDETKLVSKKLLVAILLIGKRFKRDYSAQHTEICDHIVHIVKEECDSKMDFKTDDVLDGEGDTKMESVDEDQKYLDAAWNQVNRYENMSLREREEAEKGILPNPPKGGGFGHSYSNQNQASQPSWSPQSEGSQIRYNPNFKRRGGGAQSIPTSQAEGNQVRFNPNFRRGDDMEPPSPQKYPDPSVAVPYLEFVAPTLEEKAREEKEEEDRLGKPGNLLWLYWKSDKISKRGNVEEGDIMTSGSELVFKDNRWKRIKKECHGRVAQPGEKGETF